MLRKGGWVRLARGKAQPFVRWDRGGRDFTGTLQVARQLSSGGGRSGIWGLLDAVQGRKLAGRDKHGNTYWEVANPGGKPDPYTKVPTDPKRQIDYSQKELEEIEWHHVPPEWRLWLRYARTDAPTEAEIQRGEAERAHTLERAKEIEMEDQRQRSLDIATGGISRAPGQHGQNAQIAYLADRVHGTVGGAAPAPDPRNLHRQEQQKQQTGEATGQGDSFRAGTWNPNN